MNLPKQGKVIGWKKLQDKLIAKLEIPANSKRIQVNGSERKCRAEMAKVLDIEIGDEYARKWNTENGKDNRVSGGTSAWGKVLTYYKVGEIVEADMFDRNPDNQCSHGIHFFLTREQAEEFGS